MPRLWCKVAAVAIVFLNLLNFQVPSLQGLCFRIAQPQKTVQGRTGLINLRQVGSQRLALKIAVVQRIIIFGALHIHRHALKVEKTQVGKRIGLCAVCERLHDVSR